MILNKKILSLILTINFISFISLNSFGLEQKDNSYLTVRFEGKVVNIKTEDVLASLVESEMGRTFPEEALKAQTIACHTFILRNIQKNQYLNFIYKKPSEKVKKAVEEVLDLVVLKNGEKNKLAFTPYCSCVADKTNDAIDIWGFESTSSVESKYDFLSPTYQKQCRYSLGEVKELFKNKWSLELENIEPEDIFKVLTKTKAGYNGKMSVGAYNKYFRKISNKETDITARLIREEVLTKLGSPKFEIFYDKDKQEFIFTSYGFGHGVGMSQFGAKFYNEKENWNYENILNHYYPNSETKSLKDVEI